MTASETPLAANEQEALQKYIQAGGSAVLNAFSQWSRNGWFARDLVLFLGIVNFPGAAIVPSQNRIVAPDVPFEAPLQE
eukprot:CAMPEP_0198216840 /NCGR_PEP_ID=MMETSP1445-20131203/59900_1 /TAXON_ID=36898 /ORGANISM="Pyramimonas sp., Strain CCMP2087" /LENGTH=78 /DNA_ID=CAMNT_0043893257 /DNA_START=805 /DNA_END=1038 /DNA_ORIENTATION=-